MGFPKIAVPTYEIFLPSLEKKVKYRPFLVKEEKLLLMALRGGDEDEAWKAVKQIINNCILDDDVDAEDLATFDIDYFFVQLRAKSISEIAKLRFTPRTETECKVCKEVREVEIDLTKVKIQTTEGHTKKVDLGNGVGVVMRYPKIDEIAKLDKIRNDVTAIDAYYDLLVDCMDFVWKDEEVFSKKEWDKQNFVELLERLTEQQMSKIENFFDTMPRLSHTVDLSCKDCGHNEKFVIEGFQNFFG